MERSAPQPLHIPVRSRLGDGTITGHLLQPEVSPRGVVTIHPATATPERFYFSFADALVDRGFAVVTYRMRGVGSPAARTNPRLRMSDWITEDVPAVSAWTEERFPGLPQFALGHSLGGHALLLGFGGERLSGIVTVATHRAATRDIITRTERMRVRAILSALGPALTRLLGYAPGERLGLGEDIPRAALLEWSHWVRRSDYFFDIPELSAAARMARMRTPVLSVGAADDLWRADRRTRRSTAPRPGRASDIQRYRARCQEDRSSRADAPLGRQRGLAGDHRLAGKSRRCAGRGRAGRRLAGRRCGARGLAGRMCADG
ncbi:alpha/beta hydrolase family protein [Brevibacterium oceani]|uniref:alpha/beta hydrolase family protein n=1 Tax=Brevibacterium oceani TaxID=358099 RepID=UPI001B33C77E|nr:alpha/beta hydrolase [Brevibacterium oceani]